MKFLKWTLLSFILLVVVAVGYVRIARLTDPFIYQTGNSYDELTSEITHHGLFLEMKDGTRINAALFTPDSVQPKATIFHHLGNGMHLQDAQKQYQPLIDAGFQVFAYERRGFAFSEGEDDNSQQLKEDALAVFDQAVAMNVIKDKPVLIWGQSLGGAFAVMNAAERQDKIKGLLVEGTFNSFQDMGKVYAHVLGLENFTWLVPLLMNNDFPAEENISRLQVPAVIVHSTEDNQVPYRLGEKLYAAANKENTKFWPVEGGHIGAIFKYQDAYVYQFEAMLDDPLRLSKRN